MTCLSADCTIDPTIALGRLADSLEPRQNRLTSHDIYNSLRSVADIRVFMEHHVFAVWDFMALLKALQRHLTCTGSFWRPTGDACSRRLINMLVLEEESDEIDGVPTSHFEVYLAAMRDIGADTHPITSLLTRLDCGHALQDALSETAVPSPARDFVRTTFDIIDSDRPHVICAAFTFGREQAIPGIFQAVRDAIPGSGNRLHTLQRYLDRHIELDGEDHGPKAIAMLSNLCGSDDEKWREAERAAQYALDARIAFWSGIAEALPSTITRHPDTLPDRVAA